MENNSSNKRIFKNTLLLYTRQLITLGFSLYTSRLTLKVLGVTDFGIFAAVGGITALLSILTNSMSSSTQRFMTFELGVDNHERLNKVYITSFQIHLILSLIIFIIGESAGIWFINHKLTIPVERLNIAANVFQLTLLISLLSIINIPNQAAIIAHEDMGAFAAFSISDAVLKFFAVILLFHITCDKLLGYSVFLFIIQLINQTALIIYCRIKYIEVRLKYIWDKTLIKEMFSLAGWNIISNISVVGFIQGVNILLNIFFGPALNAAYTVAMQAYSGIRSFTSSFQLASNPQIIKTYSKGELERMHSLIISVCKMSFFLIFFLSLPFVLNANAILKIWLGNNVPDHASAFFVLLLIYAYFDVFAYPLDVAAQATGKVRKYNTLVSFATLGILPISYFLYLKGAIPEIIYVVAIFMSLVGLAVRIILLNKLIHLQRMSIFKDVIIISFVVGIASIIIPWLSSHYFSNTIYNLFLSFLITFLSSGTAIYFIGLNKNEKKILIEYSYKIINRFKRQN